MLFNSWQFLLFFPIVTALYFLLPHKFRWMLLLIVSCLFYMAFVPSYILILLLAIIIDYAAGIMIERSPEKYQKKAWFIASVLSTCGILFLFKYFNFFSENVAHVAQLLHWNYSIGLLSIALPIGLSFHTFQSLSYVIEVYRGRQKAEHHFGIYALYVMFYPQLVAGPIERPQHMLHQFRENHVFEYRRVIDGCIRIAFGLFLKTVIADRAALVVNHIYTQPQIFSGPVLLIATVLFAVQIYCDFAGYSTIALGAAQVMGFRLTENFNHPYTAISIPDFWRRWHISLSSWFRDYVYIPLGGNRTGPLRNSINILVVFLLSGLWHGASWTFIIWGLIHGTYCVLSHITRNVRTAIARKLEMNRIPRLHRLFQRITTFGLVLFAWIFFRSQTVVDASKIVYRIVEDVGTLFHPETYRTLLGSLGMFRTDVVCLMAALSLFACIQHISAKHDPLILLANKTPFVRWSFYTLLFIFLIYLGKWGAPKDFIYFQF